MTITLAACLRLFATGQHPRRSLAWRAVGLAAATVILGALAYWLAPRAGQALDNMPSTVLAALAGLMTYLFISLLFFLLGSYHSGLALSLEVMRYLPLSRQQQRWLYALGYAPLALLSLALSLPTVYRFLAGNLPPGILVIVLLGSSCLALAWNILIRLADSPLTRWPQALSLAGIALAAWLSWRLFSIGAGWSLSLALAIGLAVLGVAVVFYLTPRPLRHAINPVQRPVREHPKLGIMSGLIARALRTRRFWIANMTTLALFGGLAGLAYYQPQAVSFDLAAAVSVLLAGTLGQEARALSRRLYPQEAVNYGVVGRWVAATWVLALANVILVLGLVLVCAELWFDLSVGYGFMLSLGLSLAAHGLLAASIVVPAKGDVLAQLVATGLYCLLGWAAFKLWARFDNQLFLFVVAAALTMISLALSFAWEKWRWLITIRGRRANLHQTT